MKKYLRSLVEEFPHAAAESYHVFGWRGAYLACCAFVLRRQPFPVRLGSFGGIDSWGESINIVDNFSWRELRCESVEAHLRSLPAPLVVDVGVNVGVTCRWWLSLAPTVVVVGIDMFQESLDFATRKIGDIGGTNRWHPICVAVGDRDETIEVRFTDPLEGTSSIDAVTGDSTRRVRVRPLDDILAQLSPVARERIALLKLDIEGAAGRALVGASRTLDRCDYVTVETHSDEETSIASSALIGAGFHLFHCQGRTIWWRRNQ